MTFKHTAYANAVTEVTPNRCTLCVLASWPTYFYPSLVPFRSSPRKLADDSDLYAAALRALMRRPYSIHEMKEYLNRRAEDKSGVTVVLTHLREKGYLDDAKYARDYARLHAQLRKQGRYRITRELRGRGVPDQHIEAALDSVFAETDETAMLRTRIQRKLSLLKGRSSGAIDQKKIASLYRNLMAAGFSADAIRKEIQTATKVDPDAIVEAAPEED
jgi:regulatory protein